MPKVWIVNESGHTYEQAEKFGKLDRFTRGSLNIFKVDRISQDIAAGIALTEEEDYLLLSGSPILNALAFHFWLRAHPKCELLQWHASLREYIHTTVTRTTMDRVLSQEMGL